MYRMSRALPKDCGSSLVIARQPLRALGRSSSELGRMIANTPVASPRFHHSILRSMIQAGTISAPARLLHPQISPAMALRRRLSSVSFSSGATPRN